MNIQTVLYKYNNMDNLKDLDDIYENQIFIKKTHDGLDNLFSSYDNKIIEKHSISILKAYIILDNLLMKNIFIKVINYYRNNSNCSKTINFWLIFAAQLSRST